MKQKFTIIGGGIAGLTTALALSQSGIDSEIFEASPEIKAVGAGLGLGGNAIKAFMKLGIAEEVMNLGRFMDEFIIKDYKGKTITRADSKALGKKYGVDNFTIHRVVLHDFLLSRLNQEKIQTNKKLADLKLLDNSISLEFEDGTQHETEYLIAAEGIHSVVRKKLVPGSEPRYAGYTCWRTVIDNNQLKLNGTYESWGPGRRFGIVPLAGDKIYLFATLNAPRHDPAMKAFKVQDLQNTFRDFHSPVGEILEQTRNEDLLWNDIIDIKPINRFAFDRILLIGDAAHATTPNMGQGACQAIEDSVVLSQELARQDNPVLAFKNFEQRRLKRTHYITKNSWNIGRMGQVENKAVMAIRNFILRHLPPSFNENQMKMLYQVDFMD